MKVTVIPISTDGEANLTFRSTILDRDFDFTLDWNGREGRWYLSIAGFLDRKKVLPSVNMVARVLGLPPGLRIFFVNFGGDQPNDPPGFNNIGVRCLMVFDTVETQEDDLIGSGPGS